MLYSAVRIVCQVHNLLWLDGLTPENLTVKRTFTLNVQMQNEDDLHKFSIAIIKPNLI